MKQLIATNKNITENDLALFKEKTNISLPHEYEQFLLKFNGGRMEDHNVYDFFDFNLNKKTSSNLSTLAHLLPLKRNDVYSLYYYYDTFKDRIPTNTFPIGNDDGGNLILINLDSQEILFWDHEYEADPDEEENPNDVNNVYFISQSFNAFINSLY